MTYPYLSQICVLEHNNLTTACYYARFLIPQLLPLDQWYAVPLQNSKEGLCHPRFWPRVVWNGVEGHFFSFTFFVGLIFKNTTYTCNHWLAPAFLSTEFEKKIFYWKKPRSLSNATKQLYNVQSVSKNFGKYYVFTLCFKSLWETWKLSPGNTVRFMFTHYFWKVFFQFFQIDRWTHRVTRFVTDRGWKWILGS